MLEVLNISKIYRGIPAVDDVSFRIGQGEIVGYPGPMERESPLRSKSSLACCSLRQDESCSTELQSSTPFKLFQGDSGICSRRSAYLYPPVRA